MIIRKYIRNYNKSDLLYSAQSQITFSLYRYVSFRYSDLICTALLYLIFFSSQVGGVKTLSHFFPSASFWRWSAIERDGELEIKSEILIKSVININKVGERITYMQYIVPTNNNWSLNSMTKICRCISMKWPLTEENGDFIKEKVDVTI